MKNIIAFGGSNSKASINQALAIYVAKQLQSVHVEEVNLNDFSLPIYGVDLEQEQGIAEDAKRLNDLLSRADGFVISLAEHNGSYTAFFKNIIDWLSRVDMKVWKDKPVLLLATSPGGRGGATVLETARISFPFLGGNVVDTFAFPSFYDNFSTTRIINEELETELQYKIKAFQEAVDNTSL